MYLYRGETPIKIYRGNHDIPKIYRGDTLLCDENTNIEPYKKISQIIVNGDFSNGTTGWVFIRVKNPSIIDGWLNYTLNSSTNAIFAQDIISAKWIPGHKYYVSVEFNNDITRNIGIVEADYGTFNSRRGISATIPSGVQKFSTNFIADKNGARLYLQQFMSTLTEVCRFRNFIVINLTDAFGAGNEPTKAELDNWFNNVGYFNGSKMF